MMRHARRTGQCTMRSACCQKHPENLTFLEEAASWMMYVTAHMRAGWQYGNLQAGQNRQIRAASSSVGLAAIQTMLTCWVLNPIALPELPKKSMLLTLCWCRLLSLALSRIGCGNQSCDRWLRAPTHIVFDPVGAGRTLTAGDGKRIFARCSSGTAR